MKNIILTIRSDGLVEYTEGHNVYTYSELEYFTNELRKMLDRDVPIGDHYTPLRITISLFNE